MREQRSLLSTELDSGWATFGDNIAFGVLECIDVLAAPEKLGEGNWFVVGTFEGTIKAWRFESMSRSAGEPPWTKEPTGRHEWAGPSPESWNSSMDRAEYIAAVARVRDYVRAGEVYQANICRVLSAPLHGDPEPDAWALAKLLAQGNPAPHSAAIHVPASTGVDPVWVVSASPELYLSIDPTPSGTVVSSSPIKGTAPTVAELADKDRAENVMIVDLVRNDLHTVCEPGTVEVTSLLGIEHHPGLVHLVSRVQGVVRRKVATSSEMWRVLLEGTFPPGSVSGAPKSSALRIISELEPVERGPYCGAVGWVADGRASIAVGIRTFWWSDGLLRFGTGAGITWGSVPSVEWSETELKASRLVALASSETPCRGSAGYAAQAHDRVGDHRDCGL
ncbi:chorismate-binding protein [Promicromonospora sukumoe]|uniref:Para-aminobenzoate synthetase component 1 n=1 Tax=Promicromonospora sukumoe TaxID=88382 RepID=A0A7W3J4Z5_9MICO|nr:anthranilate synthase component I family protein [Promicromonospora sukumoe]MBA8806380.1 para-aminobenzoate synthetase component 1 [Promicromonospora sukumoe]